MNVAASDHTHPQLFHDDNQDYFDYGRLRKKARDVVDRSSLIQRCQRGDKAAAIALKMGFYAYVEDFQRAIDQRANSSRLPRQPLYDRFGYTRTRCAFVSGAKAVRDLSQSELDAVGLDRVIDAAENELRDMQREERTHYHHWVHDAMALGLTRKDLKRAPILPAVQQLIDAAHCEDLLYFFAGSLGATEFMAEELGVRLADNDAYRALFVHGRSSEHAGKPYWMIVHTVPHVNGPSHADIVLDFARAYTKHDGEQRDLLHELVELGLEMFGAAADQVEQRFAPLTTRAAE